MLQENNCNSIKKKNTSMQETQRYRQMAADR
jgi:hypothetical protein